MEKISNSKVTTRQKIESFGKKWKEGKGSIRMVGSRDIVVFSRVGLKKINVGDTFDLTIVNGETAYVEIQNCKIPAKFYKDVYPELPPKTTTITVKSISKEDDGRYALMFEEHYCKLLIPEEYADTVLTMSSGDKYTFAVRGNKSYVETEKESIPIEYVKLNH